MSCSCSQHPDPADEPAVDAGRRGFVKAGAAITAATMAAPLAAAAQERGGKDKYADPDKPLLPPSDMSFP